MKLTKTTERKQMKRRIKLKQMAVDTAKDFEMWKQSKLLFNKIFSWSENGLNVRFSKLFSLFIAIL